MAMGAWKDRARQGVLWLSSTEIRATPAHPFHQRLNELLAQADDAIDMRLEKWALSPRAARVVVLYHPLNNL
jgi:hypothetical protein